MKRTILAIGILLLIGILFRGWIYQHVVTYKSVGVQTNYPASNTKLTDYVDSNVTNQTHPDIEEIIKNGLSLTSRQLHFSMDKNENDPNKLIDTKTAHCVGYTSFFTTICNFLLKENGLSDRWVAKHQVGKLYVFGTNFHDYFSSPFFKDHDFVTIENDRTG